jgi:hypothetical protein
MAVYHGSIRVPSFSAAVIEAARRRHRRQVLATAVAVASAATVAGLALAGLSRPGPSATPRQVPAAAALARAPSVGMACLRPRACDRVGVAVWLRRPARSVSAIVAGHAVTLDVTDAVAFDATAEHTRTMFVGYFHWSDLVGVRIVFDAGPPSSWSATTPAGWPNPNVRLRIDYGRAGGTAATGESVALQGGWG